MGTAMRSVFVFFILVIVCQRMDAMLTCWEGTYVHKFKDNRPDVCTECPDGTVMPHKEHQKTSCLPCEKVRDSKLEILVSPCNKTHQAVIHCVEGYYRDPDYHGAPECRPSPWFCRRGQYFNTDKWGCSPCPENTFMPLDYHVEPECWKCREYHKSHSYRPVNSVIIQPCNRTHAPVIRCEDGFFMDRNMGYRDDATGCSPCTDCSTKTDVQYEGRKCDSMEDTVCCPQPNMAVIDTPNGPVCCPEANMAVINTLKDAVCCLQSNMAVIDTPHGHVCCPEANMTVVDTPNGPECVPPSSNVDHVPPVSLTDQATVTDPDLKDVISADVDSKLTDGSRPMSSLLFTGILVGIFVAVVYYLIYRRFFRRRWHRWLNARKRSSRSESDVQSEDGGAGENDSLQGIPKDRGNQNRLRHRVAGVIYDGAERLQNRFPVFGMQHTTNDVYGRVQCCGDESDLHAKKEACTNITDHKKCISVQVFDIQHLSEGFRDGGKMAYIKAVCDLTVRLKVNHTSSRRPKNYPCRNLGGNVGGGIKRFGTGLVFQVRKKFAEVSNITCPCRYCSVYPNEAKTNWAEFAVVTAAQIVYDKDECKRTSCRLQFDSDEDFVHAPSLKGKSVMDFHKSQDFRVMCCVTHDQEVSQRLEGMVAHFNELRQQYNAAPENAINDDKLAVLISQHHGLSKKIQTGRATVKMDGEIQKWSYDVQTCPGSCGAPVCILRKGQGSGILTTLHSMENESTGFYI